MASSKSTVPSAPGLGLEQSERVGGLADPLLFPHQGTLYVTIPIWRAAGSHWVRRKQQSPVGRAWLRVSKSGCCSIPL